MALKPAIESIREGAVRAMRDRVFEKKTSDNNWEGSKDHWMKPENLTWLHDECARMFMAGKPDEFEKMWLDSESGRVAKLSEHSWFADAKPIPRRIASESIRHVVQGMVEYTHWAKTTHDSE